MVTKVSEVRFNPITKNGFFLKIEMLFLVTELKIIGPGTNQQGSESLWAFSESRKIAF